MAKFLSIKCHKCFKDIILVLPQKKDGSPKGPWKGKCLLCFTAHELPAGAEGYFNPESRRN